MRERLISRREMLIGTGLTILGAPVLLQACAKVFPTIEPTQRPDPIAVKPTQKPSLLPSDSTQPNIEASPATNPPVELTPNPTLNPRPEPTPTPTVIVRGNELRWIRYQGPLVVWHGDRSKPEVYLTMDDCWDINNVNSTRKTARSKEINMTFLPVGKLIPKNPKLYKEIIDEGNDVQNHTWSHGRLDHQSRNKIIKEISLARDALWNAAQTETQQKFVRPPGEFGVSGTSIWLPFLLALEDLGYKALVWDVDSGGTSFGAFTATAGQVAKVERNVEHNMRNGSIALQHAIKVDVAAFPHIISTTLNRGFKPITIFQGLG